jgi:hypothetical protein
MTLAAAELPPEVTKLLEAVYNVLRGSDDPATRLAAMALVPTVGRIHANLPVRPDDCRHAADLLTHRTTLLRDDEEAAA